MAQTHVGTAAHEATSHPREVVVGRVVVSPKDAPVTETALVLSDDVLAQLVITRPLPSSTK